MIWALIIVLIAVIDQMTKMVVTRNIFLAEKLIVIDKFFFITHYENKGIAWSLLQNRGPFLIAIVAIVTIILIYVFLKTKKKFISASLAFILGGAIGNLIDRIIKGSVTDFLEFHFGSYIYPIFNIADIFVVLGIMILLYYNLRGKRLENDKAVTSAAAIPPKEEENIDS